MAVGSMKWVISVFLGTVKIIVVALGVLIIGFFILFYLDEAFGPTDDKVLRKTLTESIGVIKSRPLSDTLTIDMARLTAFHWDTLYVFRGTNSEKFISQAIGTLWDKGRPDGWLDESPDNLLVFLNKQKIVSYVWYKGVAKGNTPESDFIHLQMNVNSAELFTPATAKFIVYREKWGDNFIQVGFIRNESVYRPGFNPRNVNPIDY